jgi:hypothetical protein
MSPDRPRANLLPHALLAGGVAALAFRFWTSFCFFPLAEWNSVRLAPTFMLCFGPTPYPGLDTGPLTTWIYGPVPLLLNLPAVLAPDTIAALFTAGIVNLLCAVVPAALAVFAIAAPGSETTPSDRSWALLLCLALWPNSSLQYIQADNAAIAFGLLANVLLVRAAGRHGVPRVLAGLCTALAIWSKQTAVGLVLAQVLWLGFTAGRRTAVRHAVISAAFVLALGGIFAAWFGLEGLWLNLVRIPGRLPVCDNFLGYTRDFWMQISGYVLLPAAGVIAARRTVWKPDSPWLLPVLSWLCLLPAGVISIYKVGGATNSLSGFLYLLPLAALGVVTRLRPLAPRAAPAWLAAGLLAILTQQLAFSPVVPLRPLTGQLHEAEQLAREFRGRIYFPWHPLVTFFSEHRFYHAEDGLYTRRLVQLGRNAAAARRDLPPEWSMTAIPGWRNNGIFRQLQPPGAQLLFIGKWSVYVWPPARPK